MSQASSDLTLLPQSMPNFELLEFGNFEAKIIEGGALFLNLI